MRYRLTEAARHDVREITHQIRYVQKSPQNARLVATRLKATFNKLVELPLLWATCMRNLPTIAPASTRLPGCS
jgi:plasmid stabilization system protein ParE